MPIIGQPAHTHFTPVVSAIVLTRISLSVTYLYNIIEPAYRISLSQTYVYNLKVIISRSQVYIYTINPVVPVGPTRLYFHAVLNPLPNLPTTDRSTLTPNKTVDVQTVNRTMSTTIGIAQTSLILTSNATTALQRYYFTKFVTDTLRGISSITAQTWKYNFASKNSSAFSQFPVSASTNKPVRVVAYVWRPAAGGGSKVGDIVDGPSSSTVDIGTSSETVNTATFSGIQVLNVQDGDVLVFEVWFEITQFQATAFTDTFYYDGTTVTTTKNTPVTSHASFIETPQGLDFGIALVRISKSCTQRYDLIGQISLSQVYNYDLTTPVSPSYFQTYQYTITALTSLSSAYLYNLTGRISVPSTAKYDLLKKISAPKIYRYSLRSITSLTRAYKYNIANSLTTSKVYKYNIGNVASLSQVYKYTIYKAVSLSRLYRYGLNSRTTLTRLYRYYIANRITHPVIFRYGLAIKLLTSRIYKYNLTNLRSASSHYRYSLLSKLSASKIFKYGIATKVTLTRLYKYNLTSFSQVSLSTIYKYNLVKRLSLSRLYGYAIATKLSVPRTYRYNIAVRTTISRIYRYAITNRVTLNRIQRYNILIRLLSTPKTYRYNLLALRQKSQAYLYNLTKTISRPRTYIYRLGVGVSLSQTYIYNQKARVSLSSKYIYQIAIIPSGVLWQLTGKNTDFPDSIENLVKDFIKENWSITDPVLGSNPAITTVLSRQHQSQVDNFAYDNFRSYYIRVKEVASEVKNRLVRLNTYEFTTPVELECFSRRLKKGEAFSELNNIMNELLRIFGTYQVDGIFGVQGITLDRISNMEKERPPATTTWARRLRIILYYYKVSVIG